MTPPAPQLTADHARDFLASHLGRGVRDVELVGQGEWSRAYAFHLDGRAYVARFGPYVEDFAKDEVAARFASTRLPIPRITAVDRAFDGYFAVSDRVIGEPFDVVDATQMRALVPAVLAMLDGIREADVSSSVGFGRWDAALRAPQSSWAQYLLSVDEDTNPRVLGWRERLEQSPTGSRVFARALEALRALAPGLPDARYLVQADLLNRNVLVDGDRVSGVIDWGNALFGDFVYDLAILGFWAPWYSSMIGIDWAIEAQRHYEAIGLEVPRFEERLAACSLQIGLEHLGYNAWRERWEQLELTAARTLEFVD